VVWAVCAHAVAGELLQAGERAESMPQVLVETGFISETAGVTVTPDMQGYWVTLILTKSLLILLRNFDGKNEVTDFSQKPLKAFRLRVT